MTSGATTNPGLKKSTPRDGTRIKANVENNAIRETNPRTNDLIAIPIFTLDPAQTFMTVRY
jgi:hypothetical protein